MVIASVAGACRREAGVSPRASQHSDLRAGLASVVNAKAVPAFVVRSRTGRRLWSATREFYQKRSFAPVWLDRTAPAQRADALIDALLHAGSDALNPARYGASELARMRDDLSRANGQAEHDRAAVAFDARLTYLYFQYANDVENGTTEGHTERWKMRAPAFDPVASLEQALADDCVDATLQALQDRDPEYAALRKALARYRSIASGGGWPELPAAFRLKAGDHSPLIPVLAKRLAATGDYPRGDHSRAVYDDDLQNAVKRFESRHGLTADAVVGKAVVEALNVPAAERVRQIELNMERRRWLPVDLGARYVFVNVPEYRLEVHDHGNVPLAMRVIVGRKDAQTPAFSSQMNSVVLAPFWNIPTDIAENETLPSAMRDPEFFERTNMEVVDRRGRRVDPDSVDLSDPSEYRIRQRPGASNSLGLVKFMFPNPYNVYLHDTPADHLFTRETRTFSHGCIRIEEPEKLAQYVLSDQPEWTPDRIRTAMDARTQTTVTLREKIPVYITYFTVRASSDGNVMFFRDVYGRDSRRGAP